MEFGGGYGALCLAVKSGGFTGQYVIFDLPVFSQVFFLKKNPRIFVRKNKIRLRRKTKSCSSSYMKYCFFRFFPLFSSANWCQVRSVERGMSLFSALFFCVASVFLSTVESYFFFSALFWRQLQSDLSRSHCQLSKLKHSFFFLFFFLRFNGTI